MSDAIADLVKDFKLKLPDRRYLFMYASPQMENFREMGALDAVAKKQQEQRIVHEEVLEQAREGGAGNNVPDLTQVHEAVARQANMEGALRQQMENLAATHAREQEGMRRENARELERLAGAQRAEAEKARIAREVTQVHLDGLAADRDRMRDDTAAAGVTHHNVTHLYDQRVTNTQNTMENNNVHATMMNFLANHQGQLAAFAQQQGMTHERAMKVLYEHLQKQEATQQPVIQILQQTLANPNLPNENKPPPPNPPSAASSSGYGKAPRPRNTTYPYAVSAPQSFAPAPVPVATLIPTTQASDPLVDATMAPARPPPPLTAGGRGSRSELRPPPAGRGRKSKADMVAEDTPVSTRASSRAPANVEKPTPTIDAAMPSALKRAASQEVDRVPVIGKPAAPRPRPASVGEEVPVIRAKPEKKSKPDPETPRPARSRSRTARSQSKEVVTVPMNTGRGKSRSRPPVDAPETPQAPQKRPRSKTRSVSKDVVPVQEGTTTARANSRKPEGTSQMTEKPKKPRAASRIPREASETPQMAKAPKLLAIEDGEMVPPVQATGRKTKVQSAVKQKPKTKIVKGTLTVKEALRAQIKRVRIEGVPVTKRGKGRPPGSLNKATLARQAAGRVLVPA